MLGWSQSVIRERKKTPISIPAEFFLLTIGRYLMSFLETRMVRAASLLSGRGAGKHHLPTAADETAQAARTQNWC